MCHHPLNKRFFVSVRVAHKNKMAACDYWTQRFNAQAGSYDCPWCARVLKPKLSTSVKNPGKTFVSCSKDFGGCGLFSFLDSPPNEKFNPNGGGGGGVKRERSVEAASAPRGTNIVGPIVNAPNVTEQRLADLAAKIDGLASKMEQVLAYVKEVNDD